MDDGVKESEGKLEYELCWRFISAMAKRMAKNKGKYEPFNWKKPMNVDKLIHGIQRHQIEIMEDNYEDDGDEFGHIVSHACNAMMVWYQLTNYKKNEEIIK